MNLRRLDLNFMLMLQYIFKLLFTFISIHLPCCRVMLTKISGPLQMFSFFFSSMS